MNKKLQIFVSATYMDLLDERQMAVQAILSSGHIPAGMELFKSGKKQLETIYKWIDDSDVFILILGGRYGSIEKSSGKSYTHLEYEHAIAKKPRMPIIPIILSDSFLYRKAITQDNVFEEKNKTKYNNFKKLLKDSRLVSEVDDLHHLESAILRNLNGILDDLDYHLAGWIKSDYDKHNLVATIHTPAVDAKWIYKEVDTVPPTVEAISLAENKGYGCFVLCRFNNVRTISRVQLPTWTVVNNQYDIITDWMVNPKCSGFIHDNFAVFPINISDYNNRTGKYASDIYIFDEQNNWIRVASLLYEL